MTEIRPVAENRGFDFSFWNDWQDWFKSEEYSWQNFSFINLEIEHSPYKGSSEIQFALAGFHMLITYVWNTHALDGVREIRDEYFKQKEDGEL